jgi:hypothetical protein
LKKKLFRGATNKGWKCSFRYCNYFNSEDVFTCKSKFNKKFGLKIKKIDCSTINHLIKEQILKKTHTKRKNEAILIRKCMSIPIYYEIKSTEKFKKENIKKDFLKNFGGLILKNFESNIKKENSDLNKISNINEMCIAKEKEEEIRKKYVLQKVKNVKDIIVSLNDTKKLSNNNDINSTNNSWNLFDNSIANRDLANVYTNNVSNISGSNKEDKSQTRKLRNYGRSNLKFRKK